MKRSFLLPRRVALLVAAAFAATAPARAQGVPLRDSMPLNDRRSMQALPIAFTGPLTGIGAGATLIVISGAAGDSSTRPTEFQVTAVYTQKTQVYVLAQLDKWSAGNKVHIMGELEGDLFPSPFYGIGPTPPDAAEENYDLHSVGGFVRVQRETRPHLYLSGGLTFKVTDVRNPAPGGLLAPGTIAGSRGGHTILLDAGLVYDTRDNPLNAHRGTYLGAFVNGASRLWGSGFEWSGVSLDARSYVPLGRGRSLAMQWVGQTILVGTPPFDFLPNFGGPFDMRAYVNNRWRDRNMTFAQAELRTPLVGRFSGVLFAGAGAVAPTLGSFRLDQVRPSVGLGLRYRPIRARDANIRADLGVGQNAMSFYIQFTEAF